MWLRLAAHADAAAVVHLAGCAGWLHGQGAAVQAHTRNLTDAEQSLTCCVLKADSVAEMLEWI